MLAPGRKIAGVLLAAGSGRRYGRPKALVDPLLDAALAALVDADPILVVVGAEADAVASRLPAGPVVVTNPDHAAGMGSSLRLGLLAAAAADVDAAVVLLVDLPDVTATVVARIAAAAGADLTTALVRAVYGGRPGHPVLLGRDHLRPAAADLSGDRGARGYLREHEVVLVECGDLATGRDVDRPGLEAPATS